MTDYTYDDRDQLTGADRATGDTRGNETYQYDANGNRVDSHLHGTGYVTGEANRLMSDGTYNYEYDAEGNMTLRTKIANGDYRVFEWDHRTRLVAVNDFLANDTAVQEVEFIYDTFDRRIFKQVDGTPTDAVDAAFSHYVYDRAHISFEFADSDGQGPNPQVQEQRYLHGEEVDQVLAQENSLTSWHLADHLGTIHDLVDESGMVLSHLTYDSFGRHTATSTIATTGLYIRRETMG